MEELTFSPSEYGSRAVFQDNLMIMAKRSGVGRLGDFFGDNLTNPSKPS